MVPLFHRGNKRRIIRHIVASWSDSVAASEPKLWPSLGCSAWQGGSGFRTCRISTRLVPYVDTDACADTRIARLIDCHVSAPRIAAHAVKLPESRSTDLQHQVGPDCPESGRSRAAHCRRGAEIAVVPQTKNLFVLHRSWRTNVSQRTRPDWRADVTHPVTGHAVGIAGQPSPLRRG
jgi:hypothetical protein